ncbi:hypothetical protein Gohar_000718 [Gossypium harknessii]|uniref:RNase H type-1 domain-containing protein n=1 Tax=Gossypium harknessii TaxID=34285 RepID=A0A7J9I1K4_9ROSI|nr:hypothetical protein [Gossypium harknessii]
MRSCKKDRGIRKSRCGASLGNSKDPKGLDSFFGLHSNYVLHAIRDYTTVKNVWGQLILVEWFSRGKANDSRGKMQSSFLTNSWVILSINGSVLKEAGFVAVRGIVRDQGGAWIFGFNKYLGNCSNFYNEAWGILERLSLLIEWSYDNVLIQFDCLETVIAIQERSFERSNSALVRRIHQTLSWFKQWSIRHISREENSEADHLVKLVQHRTFDLCLFETSLLEGLA